MPEIPSEEWGHPNLNRRLVPSDLVFYNGFAWLVIAVENIYMTDFHPNDSYTIKVIFDGVIDEHIVSSMFFHIKDGIIHMLATNRTKLW